MYSLRHVVCLISSYIDMAALAKLSIAHRYNFDNRDVDCKKNPKIYTFSRR